MLIWRNMVVYPRARDGDANSCCDVWIAEISGAGQTEIDDCVAGGEYIVGVAWATVAE